jgi:hypothetical protein
MRLANDITTVPVTTPEGILEATLTEELNNNEYPVMDK